MKVLIKEIANVTAGGVELVLTEKASLNGDIKTNRWFVSWDKIGRALFGDQYSDTESIKDLRVERREKKHSSCADYVATGQPDTSTGRDGDW